MNANNTYFENLKARPYEERRAAHEAASSIIDTYGWDSEELKNWYAEKEAMASLRAGNLQSLPRMGRASAARKTSLRWTISFGDREVSDFIDTLRWPGSRASFTPTRVRR